MALDRLTLDDLNWADMAAAIRGRIISASVGQWTLHAPVDPGVTLLELFAWLLEQRIYFIDQVPPGMQRGLVRLFGDAALPETPASTVLAFQRDGNNYLPIPAGTLMVQRRRGEPPVFSTESDFTWIPVGSVGLFVGDRDRSLDLLHGRTLLFFPQVPPFQTRIVLYLHHAPSATDDGFLSLLLELTPPATIPPQWAVDAPVDVPLPAQLRFSYPSTGGGERPFSAFDDGTGGLRRSGVLRLRLPPDWKQEALPPDPDGNLPFAIKIETDAWTYSAPPRLAGLTPNVAIAHHRRPAQYHPVNPLSWVPVAGMPEIELPQTDRPPIVPTVKLSLKERNPVDPSQPGTFQDWTPVDDLSFSGPGDRVFVVDRASGIFRFGDGLTSRIPVLDDQNGPNVTVDYEVGAGPAGNIGSGAAWDGPKGSGLLAYNPVPAEGGSEAESLSDALQRVGRDQNKPTRAITGADYQALVEKARILDEGRPWGIAVKRAHAAVGFLSEYPCLPVPGAVTLFIVPDVPHELPSASAEAVDVAAPEPDPGMLRVVRQRLEQARLVGSELRVSGPLYAPVRVVVDVAADARDPLELRRRVSDRVRTYLHPLRGGDPLVPNTDGTGWPFGAPIRPSALLEQVQLAMGDDGQATGLAIGVGNVDPVPSCVDVPIGPHHLIDVRQVTVRLSSRPAPPGGLR
jgi:hypothetical protein